MPSPRRLISTGSPFEQTMGYSRAVVQGDWCFVAGVTGYDYATMTMPESAAEQAEKCFATIEGVMRDGNSIRTLQAGCCYIPPDPHCSCILH